MVAFLDELYNNSTKIDNVYSIRRLIRTEITRGIRKIISGECINPPIIVDEGITDENITIDDNNKNTIQVDYFEDLENSLTDKICVYCSLDQNMDLNAVFDSFRSQRMEKPLSFKIQMKRVGYKY